MTPLAQRRLNQFTSNKRAYRSLWIFLTLFGISLFSEFVANDKPILMYHQDQLWMPVLVDYSEKELGGELDARAAYWDPYVENLVEESGGWMLWPPIRFSYKTAEM